jgi:acetylornithine aminotransferase
MPGYRSGFVAGDPEIVAALKQYRPNVGVAPPEFFQRAAIAAWGDEAHVAEVRARYRAKREVLLPALEALGLRSAGGDATFFLWMEGSDSLAAEWLEQGVIVAPGSFFGPAGEGYLRLSAFNSRASVETAIERIRQAFGR